ncbi:MAG: PIN domain-containing protein [Flavobacteriales bacterium]|jgi:predicted nucleic acid-binding protein|nr:PIN domain-containing protein [Flavobacteriales bacterium]MBK6893334.1 PIN domain-containing protein [Flavobacteriales bacterium]MBK7248940.1 PIN domain-containing protein [Flavobacteriales bacterium]MBK7288047.1 PIN domain-containing protein [Flavobacteriales bacterium]MBK9058820.1 PIN domain-containing protein [Flavobacteriales bacterium]
METVLIDTSILVGLARNEAKADAALSRVNDALQVICDVVLSEMLDGARNEAEHDRIFLYLNKNFEILPLTMEVSVRFREILRSKGKDRGKNLADYLIAAIAIAHDIPLLTLNTKHFKGIKGLQLA